MSYLNETMYWHVYSFTPYLGRELLILLVVWCCADITELRSPSGRTKDSTLFVETESSSWDVFFK